MGLFSKIFGAGDSKKKTQFKKIEQQLAGDSDMINFTKARWLTSRGNYYGQQNWLNQAITDFKEAITLNPNYTPAYVSLSICYRVKRMFSEAITILEKAPKEYKFIHDDRTIDWDSDINLKIFKETIKEFPKKLEVKIIDWKFQIYLNLGLVYMDMGDKEKAIEFLEKSLKINDAMAHDPRVIKEREILEMMEHTREEDMKKLRIETPREHEEKIEDIKKLVEELKNKY